MITTNREKLMMSCARPSNMILRKQKSLNCEPICSVPSNTRDRRFRLQKQFSMDHNSNVRNVVAIGNRSNHCQTKSSWNNNDQVPEASLRIFTAFKSKTHHHNGNDSKDECVRTLILQNIQFHFRFTFFFYFILCYHNLSFNEKQKKKCSFVGL